MTTAVNVCQPERPCATQAGGNESPAFNMRSESQLLPGSSRSGGRETGPACSQPGRCIGQSSKGYQENAQNPVAFVQASTRSFPCTPRRLPWVALTVTTLQEDERIHLPCVGHRRARRETFRSLDLLLRCLRPSCRHSVLPLACSNTTWRGAVHHPCIAPNVRIWGGKPAPGLQRLPFSRSRERVV